MNAATGRYDTLDRLLFLRAYADSEYAADHISHSTWAELYDRISVTIDTLRQEKS